MYLYIKHHIKSALDKINVPTLMIILTVLLLWRSVDDPGSPSYVAYIFFGITTSVLLHLFIMAFQPGSTTGLTSNLLFMASVWGATYYLMPQPTEQLYSLDFEKLSTHLQELYPNDSKALHKRLQLAFVEFRHDIPEGRLIHPVIGVNSTDVTTQFLKHIKAFPGVADVALKDIGSKRKPKNFP